MRETRSGVVHVQANCDGCSWASTARNSMGNAARHHDATGHTVRVEQVQLVIYGNPSAPPAGQTRIEEALG